LIFFDIYFFEHYLLKVRTCISYDNYSEDVVRQLRAVFKQRAKYLSYQAIIYAEDIKNDDEIVPAEKHKEYYEKPYFFSINGHLYIRSYRKDLVELFDVYREYADKEDIDRFDSTKYLLKYSRLEENMISVLDELGLEYTTQKYFPDLLGDKGYLRFDGCIIKDGQMLLIECQGEQHYKPVEYFGGQAAFERQQRYDKLKRDYCMEHKIPLLIIRYDQSVITPIKRFVDRKSYNNIIYEYHCK
jgi:hypothetical protein